MGISAGTRQAPPRTGHGRVWRHVLSELDAMPSVRLVDRGRADVWLAPATDAPAATPLVVQVHEVGWIGPLRELVDESFAAQLQKATEAGLQRATHVVTPSEFARRQVIGAYGWPAERVHAVAHGVAHTVFNPRASCGAQLISGPYVLSVGVLHRRKNLGALRDAVARLAARGLPHRLVCVAGAAPDRPEVGDPGMLLALKQWPGRVIVLRDLDDRALAGLMAGSSAFCLPSLFEGFGLPALEAMACGAPVLVSDRGALPEVVGDGGLVLEPTVDALERALADVLLDRDLAERLRHAGRTRAAGFDWARTAEGWLRVLRLAAQES